MLTVGEILIKARSEKKLSLEEIEKKIRIRKKFLIALEDNDWDRLPSLPYIKGFLKNYSSFLGLKPEEMIAIFRRQFTLKEKSDLLPSGVTKPLNEPFIRFTPQTIVFTVFVSFAIIFFSYLFMQYRTITNAPNLQIEKPLEGEIIYSENVTVSGKTDPDAVVSVNNQKIVLSETGEFSTNITLPPGINTIIIESTSKNSKKKSVTRNIQIQNNQ